LNFLKVITVYYELNLSLFLNDSKIIKKIRESIKDTKTELKNLGSGVPCRKSDKRNKNTASIKK